MGNCLKRFDVESKYVVGDTNSKQAAAEVKTSEAEDAAALLSGSLAYSTWVDISLQCKDLPHADSLSKSDPMGVLYEYRGNDWFECSRTEMIANNYNPSFVKRLRVMYNFETVQRFRVIVVDLDKGHDPETVSPKECNFLGSCEFVLGEVVTAAAKKLERSMTDKDGKTIDSTVMLVADEVSNCKDHYRFQLQASNLRNVDIMGKSDPFLLISRLQEDGVTWLPVYKTETQKDNLKPVWKEIHVRAAQLNNGDVHRSLLLQVFDYEANGSHRLLGSCQVTTQQLREMASQRGAIISLQPPLGKRSGDYGYLQVTSFSTEVRPSFLDYIAGGTEIGFVVAVDFTGSNGDPRLPTSKHYVSGGPTEYERAIMGIGQVLMYYDNDKLFPMFGFGGRKRGEKSANHCFALGQTPDGNCVGVDGLLAEYRRALSQWRLSGPTFFRDVISKASGMAEENAAAGGIPKYTCLLILTDGEVRDMQETIDVIIDASPLPLSILIVGIGKEEFGKMKALDSDKSRLSNGTRTASRDIVQFVEFHKFEGDGVRLAQELLAELPGQLVDYYTRRNILPPSMANQAESFPPAAIGA